METDQSVEKTLFAALKRTQFVVARESCGYSRCGRTDRGVSSAGQVVAMQLKSNIPRHASWDESGDRVVGDDELPRNGIETIHIWVPPKTDLDRASKRKFLNIAMTKFLTTCYHPLFASWGGAQYLPSFQQGSLRRHGRIVTSS
ncbi:hypothetical protein MHU86_872 [Fragilaria crotonensis]|nr:hypothetical protein MHU86_872 [Fragilaria crotonensis]